jgi:hypothetical protein
VEVPPYYFRLKLYNEINSCEAKCGWAGERLREASSSTALLLFLLLFRSAHSLAIGFAICKIVRHAGFVFKKIYTDTPFPG